MKNTLNKQDNKFSPLYETVLHFLQRIGNVLVLILEKQKYNSQKFDSFERIVKHELGEIRLRDDATQRAIAQTREQVTNIHTDSEKLRRDVDLLLCLWREKGTPVLEN